MFDLDPPYNVPPRQMMPSQPQFYDHQQMQPQPQIYDYPVYAHDYFDHDPYDLPLRRSISLGAMPAAMAKAESKSRLARDQVDILEAHFHANNKPSTQTKRELAAHFAVDVGRINVSWPPPRCTADRQNWFQNRRAKAKQERKQADYDAAQGLSPAGAAGAADSAGAGNDMFGDDSLKDGLVGNAVAMPCHASAAPSSGDAQTDSLARTLAPSAFVDDRTPTLDSYHDSPYSGGAHFPSQLISQDSFAVSAYDSHALMPSTASSVRSSPGTAHDASTFLPAPSSLASRRAAKGLKPARLGLDPVKAHTAMLSRSLSSPVSLQQPASSPPAQGVAMRRAQSSILRGRVQKPQSLREQRSNKNLAAGCEAYLCHLPDADSLLRPGIPLGLPSPQAHVALSEDCSPVSSKGSHNAAGTADGSLASEPETPGRSVNGQSWALDLHDPATQTPSYDLYGSELGAGMSFLSAGSASQPQTPSYAGARLPVGGAVQQSPLLEMGDVAGLLDYGQHFGDALYHDKVFSPYRQFTFDGMTQGATKRSSVVAVGEVTNLPYNTKGGSV
jgi:hypothetical protein